MNLSKVLKKLKYTIFYRKKLRNKSHMSIYVVKTIYFLEVVTK